MALLAAVPGASVVTISARAAGAGFVHGAVTTLGVVAGDLLYILLAILGLTLLVETLGPALSVMNYLGAVLLIGLGICLWVTTTRLQAARHADKQDGSASLLASFTAGLLITLADQKAILFYLGFLPAFIDLATLTPAQIILIMATSGTAVGGVKLVYAWLGARAGNVCRPEHGSVIKRIAAILLIISGVFILLTNSL
ncbi:threonine/homoserine/homoserine lactone efflux protein [Methylohalomonas lacus]|uniref:Threonine/homoserine/homoserine lactone efflux protein n=2 Tax=Methylohalomonas lacus TaxID=398773 RepID=A0AAE3L1X2_9GAMM|nr:threonine/homoserine/homoserine lactone efflux protein [Methylohalomonas lacus]